MIKAVIFDLDNTLLDFVKMKQVAVEKAVDAMIDAGLKIPKLEMVEKIYQVYWREGIEDQQVFDKVLFEEFGTIDYKILAAGIIGYRQAKEGALSLYPHVQLTLMNLLKKGIKMAIVSDAPKLAVWLRIVSLGLQHYFDAVVTYDDTGEKKPSAKPFQKALDLLQVKPEEECPVRTCYQKDKDRILHSLSFRLLKYKTNVFLSTTGEKFRTRLTHTLEVSQIARTICRALRLNEDLAEAIALGHDLGHTPFGHIGEKVLNRLYKKGFHHAEQSLRVVDLLEKNGQGLNLTYEVRDGILKHTKGKKTFYEVSENFQGSPNLPSTLEGQVVQFADWIAYINHDIDDAINMGLINNADLPSEPIKVLGNRHSQRIDTMVRNIIANSSTSLATGSSTSLTTSSQQKIVMNADVLDATVNLRKFLFDEVYTLPAISGESKRASEILSFLYAHCLKNFELILHELPWTKKLSTHQDGIERIVTDYLASLTDAQAQSLYEKLK